jgi:preprotein translocase subunit SecE
MMADAKKTAKAEKAGKDLPAPARAKSGGIIQFVRDVQREMSKVTWPTWKETWLTSVVVFLLVGVVLVFLVVVVWTLSTGVRWLIGA